MEGLKSRIKEVMQGKKIYFSILFVMSFGGGQRIALKGHRAKGTIPQCEVRHEETDNI